MATRSLAFTRQARAPLVALLAIVDLVTVMWMVIALLESIR